MSIAAISLSGMSVAQTQLGTAAHNVANLNTPNFRRQQVLQATATSGGVTGSVSTLANAGESLESDMVSQLVAKNAFLANLAVFKRSDEMVGALLDIKA